MSRTCSVLFCFVFENLIIITLSGHNTMIHSFGAEYVSSTLN